MKLTTGILRWEPGWEILLQQIGIDWRIVSASEEFDPDGLGAMIANTLPTSLQQRGLLEYLEAGGAVLATYGSAQDLVSAKMKTKRFASLPPSSFHNFSQETMMDIYSTGLVDMKSPDSRHHLPEIFEFGKGILVSVPFDVNELVLDKRSMRKNFYFGRQRLASEVTATVSKGPFRRFITEILEHLHFHRAIPFVHKWYFPDGRDLLFTFRVDSDQGTPNEINGLYDVCRNHSIKTMWFIDTKSHEQWLSRFRNFEEQEIGIHCYEHLSYSTDESNFQNFRRAQLLLNENGLYPKGAAAPYGTWNASVAMVFEQLGIEFSSEFGLDYDNLPFFPFLEDRFSRVLQMPIHPICVGSMLRAGYDSPDMREYFRQLVDTKLLLREPLCLYHHPTHRHLEILEDIFQYVRSKKIDNFSYTEYAEWWKARKAFQWRFEYHRGDNSITAVPSDESTNVYWRIIFPNGEESISNSRGLIPVQSLRLKQAADKPAAPADIGRTRQFDPRHLIMNLLDSWYKRTQ